MERIADASLSVLIPIHNSTWIEFLTNGEGRQVIRRFGGRHIKFGTLCPWARGQAPNHISCDIRRCHCQTRKSESGCGELQSIPNLQGQCRSRSVSQSVLVFFGLASQPAGRISPLQDNRVSWPAIEQ